MKPLYRPTLSAHQTRKNLSGLMVFGDIGNRELERDIVRLKDRFRAYSSCYPFGLWDAGLAVTSEMRAATELYLPIQEITRSFRRFLSLALHFHPEGRHTLLDESTTWLDALQRLREASPVANPGRLLEMLAADESYRTRFLFAILLPRHHGGSFCRYPAQNRFLENWIHQHRDTLFRKVRCLDAACGTGEGAYDLAILLQACGITGKDRWIHGCSIEPFELFAAAHGFFPHAPEREQLFRRIIRPLISSGGAQGMVFYQDDVKRPPHPREEPFDIILCNGLLGGPFIHGVEQLAVAVTSLARRIRPGGILLAADRFHGGWKKEVPSEVVKGLLLRRGFRLHSIEDGIAAEKE